MTRSDSLAKYAAKRDFASTPEPSGGRAKSGKRLRFVVQEHHASHLHYDFRLEIDGVLASWAVPKGVTLVPGERRLAMHVEDHPLAYRTFEGTIPKGQYGAGEVILWDSGWYGIIEGGDPSAAVAHGKMKFQLHGKKLHGTFTLVRMKPKENERGDPWLLIKDHDVGESAEPLPHLQSVMLATLVAEPFDSDEWLFEIKWDGYRAICTVDAARHLTLTSRNGKDLLRQFPDLADLADAFTSVPIMIDGEIVSLDAHGRSDFQRLQENATAKDATLAYAAFDVLYAHGHDQRNAPLEERKALLERVIRDGGTALYSKHIVGQGKAFFIQAQRSRLEGIIGKKRGSLYQERRSRDWVKIKAQLEDEFVIGGWTDPSGSRAGFGALLLGAYVDGKLRYVGHVGTGFSAKTLRLIAQQLAGIARKTKPFANAVDANATAHWVTPKLVAQVRFTEWTRDRMLRHPAFLGLRLDKVASDVVLELPDGSAQP